MVSQTSRYALRILGFLVENEGRRICGEEISAATGIPANYLSKILNQLRKQGIVDSEKGWGGGFQLREEAGQIPIRDILRVFDGVDRIDRHECVFGLPKCDAEHPCPLHSYWERINETLTEMMDNTTVRDLGKTETPNPDTD